VRRRAVLAISAALALVTGLPACTSSSTVAVRAERTGTIQWNPCGNIQCGSLSVPLDRTHPQGPHITLALARRPATGKGIGVLFTNPGGPGGSGVDFVRAATTVFPHQITAAFDIVSWDPRGVGQSAAVQCIDDLDEFYAVDRDPTTPAEVNENVAMARRFDAACKQRSGSELPFLATTESARDMDAIRAAMGEDRISYFGFSYGTLLGALYADLYPLHVRAMVLDGAVDPAVPTETALVDQARGFEQQLDAFFAWCATHSDCGFARGGNPRAAFDSLAADLEHETIPAEISGEHRTLGPGEFDIGVASALYGGESAYSGLAAALVQVARGQGSRMLRYADDYTGRRADGTYSNETAALYATSCVDAPSPRTLAGVQRLATTAAAAAPHFGPSTVWLGLPCTYWPARVTGKVAPVRAPGAPPIVVVGTTGDPATPYRWAEGLARQLQSGRLLTYDGSGHTAYGRSSCINSNVDRYLVRLVMPAPGTTC
jgi:pimeloyl-ACP methyl ester carboxylesterase